MKHSKTSRKAIAEVNRAERNGRTPHQQLTYLDSRLGTNVGAKKERARIIAKLIIEKNKGAKVIKPQPKKPNRFHCDTEDSGF